ncbi:MAG: protein kinase [Bacteroidales bacterium]|nr:protein kinase [Bacteroidales bacterium]
MADIVAVSLPAFCATVVRSQLLSEPQLRECLQKWRAENPNSDQAEGFRQYLVRQKALTEYQSQLLIRGRGDGFFIGGYTVLDRLGRGASAGVYRASHPSGQLVALKVLPVSRAKNPHILNRFQREGRLVTQLHHPNVVRAFQLSQEGDIHFIVMEHLEGETLEEVLARRKKLPPGEAVRVVHQALLGLQHLHDQHMIHRDLKPSNLMVTPPIKPGSPDTTLNATIKLLDIGIGRELFTEDDPTTREMSLTEEGAVLGTPDYLAPEQARDARSADIRSDIYSLGCVLFQLLSGRTPFTEKNAMAQMVKHATETPPALSELVTGIPLLLQSVVETMMAKKPSDRYPTPDEAASALARFLPEQLVNATPSVVLPEYEQWLESEIPMDDTSPPKKLPPPIPGPGSTASGVTPTAGPRSSVTRPSGTVRPPSGASGKPSSGPPTTKTPIVTASPTPIATPVPTVPKLDPSAITVEDEEADVMEVDAELITGTVIPPQIRMMYADDNRPLSDLGRRDFLMLGAGAGGVLVAISLGFGLARLLRPNRRPPAIPEPAPVPTPATDPAVAPEPTAGAVPSTAPME